MPYKNDERQNLAVKRNMRKYRKTKLVLSGVTSFAVLLSDLMESDGFLSKSGENISVGAVMQLLRPLAHRIDELEAISKRFEETMEAFEKMKVSGTKEKLVDHEVIDAPEYELLCPKHGRVRRADRITGSCC